MRSIQILGLISALVALVVSYWSIFIITPVSSESAASSVGLVLMFVTVPLFGFSATLLIPSSLALVNAKFRRTTSSSVNFGTVYGVLIAFFYWPI